MTLHSDPVVFVYAKRTPIGKFMGGLSSLAAPQLGSLLVKDALKTLSMDPNLPDTLYMGQVLTAGTGQAPARQTAILGGLANSLQTSTINRVCGSGLQAIIWAAQALKLQDSVVAFAGGQESMSQAPHLLMGSRTGWKFGSQEIKDHMQYDGLWDPYDQVSMGYCGELCAEEHGVTRTEQDAYAEASYLRARASVEGGLFKAETIPVEIKQKKEALIVSQDEEPFGVELSKLDKLAGAFKTGGTITAGNASSINDGAALCGLMLQSQAHKFGYKPLAKILAYGSFSQEPKKFPTAPVQGIQHLLAKAGKSVSDIDLFEINEAFSVVPLMAAKALKIDLEKINPRGGAVALGHPIGASGARILVTLIQTLIQNKLKTGLASLCIGGGESVSMLIEQCYSTM